MTERLDPLDRPRAIDRLNSFEKVAPWQFVRRVRHLVHWIEQKGCNAVNAHDRGIRRPRTQAERSSATRQLIIDAALEVLSTHGYSGATIAAIRDAAGVSNGAINHQFPTKASLMAALVTQFSEQRVAAFKAALRNAATPAARVEAMLDTTEATIRLPEIAAAMEIHLARRNDAELDRLTTPIYERFDRRVRLWLHRSRRTAGTDDQSEFDHFRLLSFAVYRGLALEMVSKTDPSAVDGALRLWRRTAMQFATQ